jgi:hypothetical protein
MLVVLALLTGLFALARRRWITGLVLLAAALPAALVAGLSNTCMS